MSKKLLVAYIGVGMVRSEDIDTFVNAILERITPSTFEGEIIAIPINDVNSRIECIDPIYITEPELIKQHTESMKKLQEELQHQTELLKKEKNE